MAKTFPTGLQDHLDGGATTMCFCWRLTRKDAVVMGFTEHDNDLTVDGTLFEAEAGFEGTRIDQSIGLAVDNLEATSAFSSDRITEDDLIAGVYDDAFVEVLWVNWADTSQFTVRLTGNLGEVTHRGVEFVAELRSLAHRLTQRVGRFYNRTCDAVFCDVGELVPRCKLDAANYTFSGTVTEVASNGSFTASGLTQTSDTFTRGVVTWTSGNNQDAAHDVRAHVKDGTDALFDLWTPTIADVQVGDTFDVLQGCAKTSAACQSYGNIRYMQGFPHIPGKDIVTDYPVEGADGQNGGALVF